MSGKRSEPYPHRITARNCARGMIALLYIRAHSLSSLARVGRESTEGKSQKCKIRLLAGIHEILSRNDDGETWNDGGMMSRNKLRNC